MYEYISRYWIYTSDMLTDEHNVNKRWCWYDGGLYFGVALKGLYWNQTVLNHAHLKFSDLKVLTAAVIQN